jgi:hypothetical protein
MARARPPERPTKGERPTAGERPTVGDRPVEPEPEVRVIAVWTDGPSRGRPGPRWRWAAIAALTLVVVALVITAVGRTSHPHRSRHRPAVGATVVSASPVAAIIGTDALAAAFRGALRCLRLRYVTSDPAFVQAVPDRSGRCRGNPTPATVIYRMVGRELRPVLDTAAYACPVRALPPQVQADLRLCPGVALSQAP